MKNYLKLMRVTHYLKNALIFLPLIFSGNFFDFNLLVKGVFAFLAFSLASSFVYIINDIRDVEKDRLHEKKKHRPIASGKVSIRSALILAIILLINSFVLTYFAAGTNILSWVYLILYVLLNLGYSLGLKNVVLVDIVILVSGFIIRVLFGSSVTEIPVSNLLYLTVMAMSFYLGLGKRRNEIDKQGSKSRKVLQFYNREFLDKNMYLCLCLVIVFYSLWCIDPMISQEYPNIIWTMPFILIICMKYSLTIESGSFGDPIDVLLSDKLLIGLILSYGLVMAYFIYGGMLW